MKIQTLIINIILFILLSTSIVAQENQVKLDENTFIDKTEVDVGSWLSYYTWILIHRGAEAAKKVLPDSSAVEPELWQYINMKSDNLVDIPAMYTSKLIGFFDKKCKECKKLGKRIFPSSRYCAMLDLPITGVSYEQVIEFCKWRTKVSGKNKYIYRLPSPDEWKKHVLSCLPRKDREKGYMDSLYKQKCPAFNYSNNLFCLENKGMMSVHIHIPKLMGAYNIFGNVSEMTSVRGVAKGGNYKLFAKQCHPDSVQNYKKPEKWLGFRCVAVKNEDSSNQYKNDYAINKNTYNSNDSKYGEFVDSRDGKIYSSVKIGDQVWMNVNLAYKPKKGKFWVYRSEKKYIDFYGYLYSWKTAQNVCPSGWHLPSKSEYETLLNSFNKQGKNSFEEMSLNGSSGFNNIGVGFRVMFNYIPSEWGSLFWTSTEKGKKAWGIRPWIKDKSVSLTSGFSKRTGLSVRCIKDRD